METVHSDLQGLKLSHIKQLEQLYEERFSNDVFMIPKFAERFTASYLQVV